MTIDLSTYDSGYYGYMNDKVRNALGALQDTGNLRAVVDSPVAMNTLEEPQDKDWVVDITAQQLYVYNSSSASWVPIGASEDTLTALINGSFDGGVSALLNTDLRVYADGAQGITDPLNLTSGWYFKNSSDVTNKINWYFLTNSNPVLTMAVPNIRSMYATVEVRAGGAPYFVMYTKPTGAGDDAAAWYRSRFVYTVPGLDLSAYIGQTIFLYWGVDPGDFPTLPRVECTLDLTSSVGFMDDSEEVMFANISTSSGYPAGHYEFVVRDAGYDYIGTDVQYIFAAPGAPSADQSTPDDAFIRMDGVNDYLSLSGTGSIMDYTATWTVGMEIVELPSVTTDSKFMTLWRSGDNGISLRRGGTNWGFYVANGYDSVAQANTWYAPSAGSRILVECDGTKISYWLDGTRRSHTTMNTTHRDNSSHVNDSIDFGRGGIAFGQGTYQDYEGGVDNLLFTNNILSSAEKAEFFAGGDVTQHSYYTAARDFVPCGEGGYPNVVGEKSNVTGTLVNGTADDFVERT
jgi:hypothetical protein